MFETPAMSRGITPAQGIQRNAHAYDPHLSWLKADAAESAQYLDRPFQRARRKSDVKLHNLSCAPFTYIVHCNTNFKVSPQSPSLKRAIGKLRVGQAMAKAIPRRNRVTIKLGIAMPVVIFDFVSLAVEKRIVIGMTCDGER